MNIAIYSRKSKITESGDSIGNQIRMCKEYALQRFDNCIFTYYEDEGFSGGNIQRPMFQKLLKDLKAKKANVLICYRLDRISRNVADFSTTLELLQSCGVEFISIKENFDTSSPMGRAMVYIASVFAQLERDTIAERIADNLYQLAKEGTGRYLNGTAPEGYKKIKKVSNSGKIYCELSVSQPQADKIRMIYDKYLELESLSRLEAHLMQRHIKTERGYSFTPQSLARILRHPIYAVADQPIYRYFADKGTQISNQEQDFDGSRGVAVFGRSGKGKGSVYALNDINKWIVGVGAHEGLVSSEKWLKTQVLLDSRSELGIKRTYGGYGVLNGLLKCAWCGSYMRPYAIHKGRFYYICNTKEKTRGKDCGVKNLRGDRLDRQVMETVAAVFHDSSLILEALQDGKNDLIKAQAHTITMEKQLTTEAQNNTAAIRNLILKLSHNDNSVIDNYIRKEIEKLDRKNKELAAELEKLATKQQLPDIDSENQQRLYVAQGIAASACGLAGETPIDRNLLRSVVASVFWDGEKINIRFFD